jgi:hypothetical protein
MIVRARYVVNDAAVMVHFLHGRKRQKDARILELPVVGNTLEWVLRVQHPVISAMTHRDLARNRDTCRQ